MNLDFQPPEAPPEKPVHWASAVQFGLSLFAIAVLFAGAALLLLTGLAGVFSNPEAAAELLPLLLMTASIFGMGVLLIPSAYYGLFHLLGRPTLDSRRLLRRLQPGRWLLLFPLVLAAGYIISQQRVLAWLALPVLHLFGVGLPIAWIVWLAVRRLPLGSSQRMWGVFNAGLVLGPFLISILEGLAILVVLIAVGVYISTQPELLAQVMEFADTMQMGTPTPEDVLDLFGPYVLSPGVIFLALAVAAGIVPLIEEALKPIGVWLLGGRKLSAPAGFAAGALSGAGFALSESLLLSSNGVDWATLIVVRIGTGGIHILTTSLVGWALALSWKQRRFGRLAAAYLTAVLIHGLWNGLTVLTVFAQAAQETPGASPIWAGILVASPLGLAILAIGAVFLLAYFNRRFAAKYQAPLPPAPRPETIENLEAQV